MYFIFFRIEPIFDVCIMYRVKYPLGFAEVYEMTGGINAWKIILILKEF